MRAIYMLGLLLVGGCQRAPTTVTTAQDLAIEKLETEVRDLRTRLFAETYKPNETAWLTPTEKSFQFLDTDVGPLALSVQGVRALGDGTEMDIQFGNPTSATINKLDFHASWGPLGKDDSFVEGEVRQGDKSVDTSIEAGSWNRKKVSFAGVPPQKLGRVVISKPRISSISLSTK